MSNTTVSQYGYITNSDHKFENPTYKIYIDDQFVYQTKCQYVVGGGGSGFQDIANLNPGTLYKLKISVEYPNISFDPFYETILFATELEKTFTTYNTPIPDDLILTFNQPDELSWRLKLYGLGCSPGNVSETIRIYLDNILIKEINALTANSYQFNELPSGSIHAARVEYKATSFNGSIIKQVIKDLTFTVD